MKTSGKVQAGANWVLAAWFAAALWPVGGATAQAQEKPSAGGGAAARPAGDAAAAIPDDWLRELSPEELEKFIHKAQELRLADERQGVIDEIEASTLFSDEAKRAAAEVLRGKPAGTQQDNVEKILAAFARADARFGRAAAFFREAKYKACADALAANLRGDETDWFSAARHYLRAEALAGLSRALAEANRPKEAREALFDAAEAYLLLRDNMPERISFGSLATQKAGRLYEDAGRYLRALKAYAFALRNYGLTLTADEDEALSRKVAAWMKIYGGGLDGALRHLAGQMGEVEKRLAASDSGKATREKEEHIVLVLEDIIKTLEEKPQPPPDPNQPGTQPPPPDPNEPPDTKPPPPPGTKPPPVPKNPVNPLTHSILPIGGPPERPRAEMEPSGLRKMGDWGDLAPTRRDRLIEIMRRTMPDRYQDLVRDYRAALSKTSGNP